MTAGVGDLAPFEKAMYRELGIPSLICIPHALAIVFQKLTAGFKIFETFTIGLSALLNAGGGTHRSAAIDAAGMDARWFRCLVTCWCQLRNVAQNLLEDAPKTLAATTAATAAAAPKQTCFDLLREIMHADVSFKKPSSRAGAAAADNDENEPAVRVGRGGKTPVKQLLGKVLAAFEVGVDAAQRTHIAEFELRLVLVLADKLPALLTMAGADAGALNPALGDKLEEWREKLDTHSMLGMQGEVLDEVFKQMPGRFNKEAERALRAKYNTLVKEASKAAVLKYDEYIPGALNDLKHTLRFHPARKPQHIVLPNTADFQIDSAFVEQQFGTVPGGARASLVKAWNAYCDGYDELPAAVKALSAGKFWKHATVQGLVRNKQRCDLGVWHGNKLTSNVACERSFGIMRTMEGPTRGALTDKAIRQELMAKVNHETIVMPMLERYGGKLH